MLAARRKRPNFSSGVFSCARIARLSSKQPAIFQAAAGQNCCTMGPPSSKQKMIGVAVFWSGDRINESHGKGAGRRFESGEATRFSYEQVGGGHVLRPFLFVKKPPGTKTRPAGFCPFTLGPTAGGQVAAEGGKRRRGFFLNVFGLPAMRRFGQGRVQGKQNPARRCSTWADAVTRPAAIRILVAAGIQAQVFPRAVFSPGIAKSGSTGTPSITE